MIRTLQTFSVLALVLTGYILWLCGLQIFHAHRQTGLNPELTIIEKFEQSAGNIEVAVSQRIHPLIQQAQNFALYLNPPKPKEETLPQEHPQPTIAKEELPKPKPKFTLIAISSYRSKPEKSLALVSEPGLGEHWIKQGDSLGHFVIEQIKEGMIVFSNGDQMHKMAVGSKVSVQDKAIVFSDSVQDNEVTANFEVAVLNKNNKEPVSVPNTKAIIKSVTKKSTLKSYFAKNSLNTQISKKAAYEFNKRE